MGALAPKPPLPPGLPAEAYIRDLSDARRVIDHYRVMTGVVLIAGFVTFVGVGFAAFIV